MRPEPEVWPDGASIDVMEAALVSLVQARGLPDSDPVARVRDSAVLARTAALQVHDCVVDARGAGVSWSTIAEQLNMSRQAAQQRYGRDALRRPM